MLVSTAIHNQQVQDKKLPEISFPYQVQAMPSSRLEKWLAKLSPEAPWGTRKQAARNLGYLRDPRAIPQLSYALENDGFWMVRCAIIQALEMIGDPRAIPVLRRVYQRDSFQAVRAHAAKAVERLS